ncbi:MAG: hypothetical protein EOO47_05205 [Flavobacterium sp.]|nr:MAG: hypothetical protein EOO47_05205 [Flavobacterium sp.]
MKRLVLIFTFTLLFVTVKAQVKPVYFHADSIVTDSTKASSYGVFGKLSTGDIYVLKAFDLYDNLLLTGTYKDEKLKVPHGKFNYYMYVNDFNEENNTYFYLDESIRFLCETGSFNNGFKIGRWVTLYPDGKIFTIVNYVNGLKQGEYKKFDRKGRPIIEGQYSLDKEDGLWKFGKNKIVNFVDGRVRSATN